MLSDLQCNNQINIVKHATVRNSDSNTYNRQKLRTLYNAHSNYYTNPLVFPTYIQNYLIESCNKYRKYIRINVQSQMGRR